MTEDEMVGWHMTDSVDMSLHKLWEMVKDREAWRAAVHGVTKNETQLNNGNNVSVLLSQFFTPSPSPIPCPSLTVAKSLQSCPTLCHPIDGSPLAPLSLGFSRQEHWSGLPFPSPMHESEK